MASKERELEFDRTYLKIANVISGLSYAKRAKVGAIIVKNGNIISFGYNGMPSGLDNCCEFGDIDDGTVTMHTKHEVLHAESNAITKLAKSGYANSDGATLYCTYSPCFNCAKLIIQAGIKRVVFQKFYETDNQAGLKLLTEVGIKWEVISNL